MHCSETASPLAPKVEPRRNDAFCSPPLFQTKVKYEFLLVKNFGKTNVLLSMNTDRMARPWVNPNGLISSDETRRPVYWLTDFARFNGLRDTTRAVRIKSPFRLSPFWDHQAGNCFRKHSFGDCWMPHGNGMSSEKKKKSEIWAREKTKRKGKAIKAGRKDSPSPGWKMTTRDETRGVTSVSLSRKIFPKTKGPHRKSCSQFQNEDAACGIGNGLWHSHLDRIRLKCRHSFSMFV